ncbi:MAG: shikimate dehydrogenase, partial [Pygmaiobacter sp.]
MTKPRYGLLGERLGHSFSKEIHEQLADYSYELIELAPDDLPAFLQKKEFAALNVTIPYKETVLPFLDHIDPRAQRIGAVNTIVNCGGLLYGYNTDFDGVAALIAHSGVAVQDKTALVLGTGGTSKTVTAVLYALGAKAVLTASRSGKNGALTYDEALRHTEVQLIFNTTPCGM